MALTPDFLKRIKELQDALAHLQATVEPGIYLLVDGTRAMAGALDMGNHAITNVVDPTNAQDAATKNYVDNASSGANEEQIHLGFVNSSTTSYTYWDTGAVVEVLVDSAQYPTGAIAYFEAVIKTSDSAKRAFAELYNVTDGADVSGSEVTTTATDWTRVRSASFSLASGSKVYGARYHSEGATAYLNKATLIIQW